MSSEADKRRILRERRAAKFSQNGGSSRLSKITGVNNSKLSAESPSGKQPHLESSPLEDFPPSEAPSGSHLMHQDPDVIDLGQNDEKPDLDKILQSMFQNTGGSPGMGSHDLNAGDLFKQFLETPPGDAPPAMAESNVDDDKFRYGFMITRMVCMLTLLIYDYIYNETSPSLFEQKEVFGNSSFYYYFLTVELVFLGTYFIKISRAKYQSQSFLVGFLPPQVKSVVSMLLKYYSLLQNFLFDLSVVVVFWGCVSVFAR